MFPNMLAFFQNLQLLLLLVLLFVQPLNEVAVPPVQLQQAIELLLQQPASA